MNGHYTAPHCGRLQERAQPVLGPGSWCPVIIHPHQRLFDPAPRGGHGGHQHIVQQATLPALADQCQCHFCCIKFFVKLREREGQGVDPGKSLKGHL